MVVETAQALPRLRAVERRVIPAGYGGSLTCLGPYRPNHNLAALRHHLCRWQITFSPEGAAAYGEGSPLRLCPSQKQWQPQWSAIRDVSPAADDERTGGVIAPASQHDIPHWASAY